MEEVHRAIHETVLDAGPKQLAHLMGMSHTSLLNRCNPNDDTHRLNVEHLLQIMLHSRDSRVLAALAHEFGFELVAKQPVKATGLQAAVLHMHDEIADVTKAVVEALEDGHVSQHEKQQIRRAIGEARTSMEVLLASVKVA
ncbi:phage regulatory CII family protein [Pseudomonas xionganensis]|uniref:Rha family transcriptional regulator n=1 Tax=Pseudomonas xionganensis TaxID=2654845 RepID=A0A6I4KRR1_9PSED|nr:phage regulatory CII family protein [Pseudomonas xionganensis]MVW75369.1 Rha family transcriptional regulator [Pseudomonas xionganensis]